MVQSGISARAAKELRHALPAWAGATGWDADVIVSTRARLARNLRALPFPSHASPPQLKQAAQQIISSAQRREKGDMPLRAVEVGKLGDAEKAALVDSHLVSLQLATAGANRWALVDDRHTISVMINEEDHLRLQAILPGLQLESAWRIADRLDDLFALSLEYACDARYGYLTASLANCGTGLRLSVMAHLPSLTAAAKIADAISAARVLGVSVRGLYGEDSGAAGDIYQFSNAVSIGLSERQIIARLSAVTAYLVSEEQAARELLWRTGRFTIESKVKEASDSLAQSKRLSANEALRVLSALRLGAQCGINTGVSSVAFSELLVSMQMGAQFIAGQKAQYTFYEETRRPALMRNKIRANRA